MYCFLFYFINTFIFEVASHIVAQNQLELTLIYEFCVCKEEKLSFSGKKKKKKKILRCVDEEHLCGALKKN